MTARSTAKSRSDALLLQFKQDTLATVSRGSVKRMAKILGFNETQVLHYAAARLRQELAANSTSLEVRGAASEDDYPPLTAEQLETIRKQAPARRRKLLTSESLF